MRKLIKNVITQEEGDLLSKQVPLNYRALLKDGVPNPIIHKVLTVLLIEAGLTSEDLHAKSYVNVERRSRGHRWHKDIGQAAPDGHAHMDWCRIGASMVLTDGFTGGAFWYKDDWTAAQILVARDKFDLVIHDSNQIHSVSPSQGNRVALLFFI